MGHWQDRLIYFRDFAYNTRRLRMASGNIGDVPAATFAELLSGPLVDVYVGESKRHWALHRNLLCHHSEMLESVLQNDGKKKLAKLELLDHDPAGFELLVKWLYQGKLDDVSDFADSNQKYDYAVSCHKLYLLCDKFDMPQLKNVAMDQYRKGLSEAKLVPDSDEIKEIYRKSPVGSPFRRLMTKIAARQIMDPESDRDVETYRECFKDSPEFAIDLVIAIKQGTGGMLFEDPTEGDECEYHDHESGTNCHIKGKGKVKRVLKATALRLDLDSSKYGRSTNDHRPLRHPPPRLIPNPQPHPQQARLQEGMSVSPVRRRLTSPASSTVEISTENATATPPSPKEQKNKFRRVTLPEKLIPSPALEHQSPPAHGDNLPSSDAESRQLLDKCSGNTGDRGGNAKGGTDDTTPRRGIWEWARGGTGHWGIMGKIPHPEWKGPTIITSKAANTAVNGALGGSLEGSLDDFSIPSTIATEPDNQEREEEAAVAKSVGFGIGSSIVDMDLFSETKPSSDNLVADANAISPPVTSKKKELPERVMDSLPATPSPQGRKNEPNSTSENSSSPHQIPQYKIALASHILSPAKTPTSAS